MCKSGKDIKLFANHCVFMRSVYLHCSLLYGESSEDDKGRMERVASIFFGDLRQIFVEYIILQVCKVTDPAQDHRKNDNHTVAFLLHHYEIYKNEECGERAATLEAAINELRAKLMPARNKLISHLDRDAVIAGAPLGVVSQEDWDSFWDNLSELIDLMHQAVLGEPFVLKDIGNPSDADGLLKALAHAESFLDGVI